MPGLSVCRAGIIGSAGAPSGPTYDSLGTVLYNQGPFSSFKVAMGVNTATFGTLGMRVSLTTATETFNSFWGAGSQGPSAAGIWIYNGNAKITARVCDGASYTQINGTAGTLGTSVPHTIIAHWDGTNLTFEVDGVSDSAAHGKAAGSYSGTPWSLGGNSQTSNSTTHILKGTVHRTLLYAEDLGASGGLPDLRTLLGAEA